MHLRRITVTHSSRDEESGSMTSVELVADVEQYDDRPAIVAMIRDLVGDAQFQADAVTVDPPDEEAINVPPPHRRAAKEPGTPEVKLGSNGWRINCPFHGDHGARLFEARDGMPARIKCTAKEDGEFCKVGAPPPAAGGDRG